MKVKFPERLKQKRQEAGITQEQLAAAAGMTARTIQNYEMGARRPRNDNVIEQLASALGCTYEELMGIGDVYIMEAGHKGGAKAARDVEDIVDEVVGLFAGGSMDDEAMDGVYRALTEAYWEAKDRNKKYAPKKFQK